MCGFELVCWSRDVGLCAIWCKNRNGFVSARSDGIVHGLEKYVLQFVRVSTNANGIFVFFGAAMQVHVKQIFNVWVRFCL